MRLLLKLCPRGMIAMAVLCDLTLRLHGGVTVGQNLGTNWIGSPVIMVTNPPSLINSAENYWGSSAPYSLGQSFSAPVSGTLTNIQMYAKGQNRTTNLLALYDMGPALRYGGGQPAVIIPGSNGISANLLTANLSVVITNTSDPQVMMLSFSGADAVNLIGGHQYYFSVSPTASSQVYWYRDGGGSDWYPGGAAYRQGSLLNGSANYDFALAASLVNTSTAPPVYHCVVDWNNVHQRIDGFGASSAWKPNWTSAQADMFFGTNSGTGVSIDGRTNFAFNGIGLSLLRTRIAPGGTTVEHSIMQLAQARGARVWSAPWSPAAAFKDNKNVNGGNFLSASNQAYANQLAGYVVGMLNLYGVSLYAISVQNEPDVSAAYESCQWTPQQIHDFVPCLRGALLASNVAATKIIVAEGEHWQTNYYALTMADPSVATNVGIVAAHNYDNTPPSGIPAALPTYSNPAAALWETEVSKLSGAGPYDGGMSDALYWAGRLHLFLTVAEVNAWHYWWLVSNNPDNEGLTDTNGVPAKRMYVLGQFSRFVRPDWYRMDEGNNNPYAVQTSAYKDPVTGNFAIIVANPGAAATNQSYSFTNFTANAVVPWITSSNLSLASQPAVTISNASFSYLIPAQSVVTFVGQAESSPSTNGLPILRIKQQGENTVISWPTNAAGFLLFCSTSLTSTNWSPASPEPVIIGDQNVVTNEMGERATFYRLRK